MILPPSSMGVNAGGIVNVLGLDAPPPVVVIVTDAVPGVAIRSAGTTAVHSPVLMYVVESAVPFQLITQLES